MLRTLQALACRPRPLTKWQEPFLNAVQRVNDGPMTIDNAIIEKLRELSVKDKCPITEKTELYYDLHLSGDDIDRFFEWVYESWDVDFTGLDLSQYSPGEPGSLINDIARLLGKRLYKSLPLSRVLNAIEKGRWQEEEHPQ